MKSRPRFSQCGAPEDVAPYKHEPGEDEKQILSPAMHVEHTKYFNLTLCVFVGVDVHGNPHCVKIHGGSARSCCAGQCGASCRRRRFEPLPTMGRGWSASYFPLPKTTVFGSMVSFGGIPRLRRAQGLSFSKERPLQRSSSAFLFSVPLQRSPQGVPATQKRDPFGSLLLCVS